MLATNPGAEKSKRIEELPLRSCVRTLLTLLLFLNCSILQGQTNKLQNAIDTAKKITVRLSVNGERKSFVISAYFLSSSGIALSMANALDLQKSSNLVTDAGNKLDFKVIHTDNDLNYSLLLLLNRHDVPVMLPSLEERNISSLREVEPVISCYGIGGGPPCLFKGFISALPTKETKNPVAQLPLTTASLGAPVLDLQGRIIGHIGEHLDIVSWSLPVIYPYHDVLTSLDKAEGYNRRFNALFNGVKINPETMSIESVQGESKISKFKTDLQIRMVGGTRVSSIHEIKMACWASEERDESKLAIGYVLGKLEDSLTVEFDQNSKEFIGEVKSSFALPPP